MSRNLILKILARLLTKKILLKRKFDRNPNDEVTSYKITKINEALKRIENLKKNYNE